ncbi:MAG: ABC transporter ATP-binding protein [Phreatobacter sp.]|uniref:ABC transporter ATP-binding protein n=1 Tax=Phreatobacter sp. TaxID=1966341 RepID=UPI002733173F|nr:ABC transporter ATP-binding protein [Phreatobacter sp.]MDP2803075.1 ABC transporter ATP-binding protein [Phreatobacter sp.]
MPYLALENIRKAYGPAVAVDRLDLGVEKGEFISLLGPSGCGKTTTLQMIAGFVEPTQGAIALDGIDLSRLAPEKRGLGIVFQSYALFPHMTVAANVAFGLEMRRVGKAEIRQRVEQALAMVGLADKGGRYPRQMSGGQQQRVALARALVIRPAILLLDEPLSNLDAKQREEMQLELRQIQRQSGTTTVLVTHDQQEALALSDRIVVMNQGRVEQIGSPFDVYERPGSAFVATFLGRTNTFSAEPTPRGLAVAGHVMMPGERPATISIRPEKVDFTTDGDGLPGRVLTRVFQGNHWLLHVETPGGLCLVIRPNDGRPLPGEGETVVLAFRARDASLSLAGSTP